METTTHPKKSISETLMRASTKHSLALAIAFTFCGSVAHAFEGQTPSTVPAKPGAASPMQTPADKGVNLSGYNPGASNTGANPNANPAVPGGINANQLAADGLALDRLLFQAIESANVEGVKSALSSGANLMLDFGHLCHGGEKTFAEDKAQEEAHQNLSSLNGFMTNANDSDGDKILAFRQGDSRGVLPTSCHRAHMAHAFGLLFGATANSADRLYFTEMNLEKLQEHFRSIFKRDKDIFTAGLHKRDLFERRLEIVMLLDANTPAADKAFYALYVNPDNNGAGPVMTTRQWAAIRWLTERYLEAQPDIEKARSLHEPARLAWDKMLSTATKFTPYEFFDKKAFLSFKSRTDDFGQHPALGIAVANMFTLAVAGANYGYDKICLETENAKKLPSNSTSASWMPSINKHIEFDRAFFDDSIDDYGPNGLERTSPSKVMAHYNLMAEFKGSSADRAPVSLGEVDGAISRHTHIAIATWLMTTPELKASMAEQPAAMLAFAQRWQLASKTNSGVSAHAPTVSGPLIRAMLSEGLISPTLRDSKGKTPTDYALAFDQKSPMFQAFTIKDYKGTGCDGEPKK